MRSCSTTACRQLLQAACPCISAVGLLQRNSRHPLSWQHHCGGALQTCQQQLKLQHGHNTNARHTSHCAAAGQVVVKAQGSFLDSLSQEQQDAVLAQEQHIRVIAGPGSGKTRVVAARVGHMLQQGVPPWSVLVITFTRKAADELKTRLSQDTGKMPHGLTACTFHSLCSKILWAHAGLVGKAGWSVADEDDCNSIIANILQPKEDEEQEAEAAAAAAAAVALTSPPDNDASSARGGLVRSSRSRAGTTSSRTTTSSSSTSSSSSSKSKGKSTSKSKTTNTVEKNSIKFFRSSISAMKSFVESTHSEGRLKQGVDIISELIAAGEGQFARMSVDTAGKLASMFDSYQRQLRWQKLMDYDDLLHHCLALLHHHPEVAAQLHKRWPHVLVDEGQDTNLCQFELVRQITGPNSKLFMVGDPDQAIYGFRGAKSSMLQQQFDKVYAGTAATYYLSDNYRSKSPIVLLADSIRRHLRPSSHKLVHGRSMRGYDGRPCVALFAADNQDRERQYVIEQLKRWHSQGYAWDEMAVLARNKLPVKMMYSAAIAAAVPCHLQVGDFWEAIEVKTALSLLRAVVYPEAASEGIKRRLIKSSADVKVPLTSGLGGKPIEAIESAIKSANLARERSSSSGGSPDSPPVGSIPSSLGGCLLAGCGLGSMTQEEAAAVMQQWQDAINTGRDRLGVLQGLAPAWQQLPGLKALTKTQRAGLDRLRGLVQVATAAAMVGEPVDAIVQLLLEGSGMVESLQQVTDPDKVNKAQGRLTSLKTLIKLAGLPNFQGDAEEMYDMLQQDENDDGWPVEWPSSGNSSSTVESSSDGGSDGGSSSDGSSSDSVQQLRNFMDYCALQGENDGENTQQRGPRVHFLTMHASKGKEFPCVALPSFYEGILPSDRESTPAALEQERNTAYVAVTRAKDKVLITWPKAVMGKFGYVNTMTSRFLNDAIRMAAADQLPGIELVE